MANGSLSIQGLQTGLPNGSEQHGPFTIPFSGVSQKSIVVSGATNQPVPIPNTCSGVEIIGNGILGMVCSFGFVSGQLTQFSGLYPVEVPFSPGAVPANVYITIGAQAGAAVTVSFW